MAETHLKKTEVVVVNLKIGVPVVAGKSRDAFALADEIISGSHLPDGSVLISASAPATSRIHIEKVSDAAE